MGGRGQRVGPAPVPSRQARTGRGYQAARPPLLVPPPLPRFLAAPRPGPVCAAALGPGTAPPPHPREPRAARGESEAPASPRACGPLPTAPPPGPLPAHDSAPGGVARLPRARAPGCFPFPSPLPWPPRLRRLLLRRRRSEQAGGRMDGAGGPGEYGAGRAACPFPERRPVWRCHCPTAVPGVPACSLPPGAPSILHCSQAAPPSYLGPPTVISDFDNAILPPVLLWAPPKFPNLLCYPGLLSLLWWVFLLLTSSVTLEPALGPLFSAANPLLSLRTSSLLSPQDDCPLSPPLLSWCSLAVSLPSLESYGYSGLGPVVPHAPPSVVPTFLGRTPYFPPGTPWYSLSLRRLGQAAGRDLCQVPRLPCQKEALDPFPTVSSPLGALPSLELLGVGSPIGQMQS